VLKTSFSKFSAILCPNLVSLDVKFNIIAISDSSNSDLKIITHSR